MNKHFIKEYYFLIGCFFNICLIGIFIIGSVYETIQGNDIYIPGILIFIICISFLHLSSLPLLLTKNKRIHCYIIGIIINVIVCLTIVGLIASILTIINFTKRERQKLNSFDYIIPPVISLITLSPLLIFITPHNIDPGYYNQAFVNNIKPDTGMSDCNVASRPISDGNVPGAHDALSYRVDEFSINTKNAMETFQFNHGGAQTQAYSLIDLLNGGFRGLDLRFMYEDGVFYASHSRSYCLDENQQKGRAEDVYFTICKGLDEEEHSTESLMLINTTPTGSPNFQQYLQTHDQGGQIAGKFSGQYNSFAVPGKFSGGRFGCQRWTPDNYFFHDDFSPVGRLDHDGDQIKYVQDRINLEEYPEYNLPNGAFYYGNSINDTGGSIHNLRNNPMQAARIQNNRLIGYLTQKKEQKKQEGKHYWYSGGGILDTSKGDLDSNHSVAAAIYSLNYF